MVKVEWQKYPECIKSNPQSFDDGSLGGCNIYGDPALELPKTWKFLKDELKVSSVVDVGCGFGFHTKYFKDVLGLDALGIDGSAKIVELTIAPGSVVCHNFESGPFVPEKTYDMCWCVEFVEHVAESCVQNFLATFKKCKYVVMTHGTPGQGGHNHVNCQTSEYWKDVMKSNGFEFQEELTKTCREISSQDKDDYLAWRSDKSDDRPYRGPAAEAHRHLGEEFLDFFFEKNGLVFKNLNSL